MLTTVVILGSITILLLILSIDSDLSLKSVKLLDKLVQILFKLILIAMIVAFIYYIKYYIS